MLDRRAKNGVSPGFLFGEPHAQLPSLALEDNGKPIQLHFTFALQLSRSIASNLVLHDSIFQAAGNNLPQSV